MTITKAPRNIKVTVPRHNAQVIGAKLDKEIKRQAKEQAIRVDIAQPSAELAQAIESASEWNSLLITARAERGPQWDIGTQQFLVEEYSDLYYDPTPLFEVVNKLREEEGGSSSNDTNPLLQQQLQQHPHPSHHMNQFPMGGPRHQTPMRSERGEFHPQMGGGPPPMDQSPMRHGHGPSGMPGNFPYAGSPGNMQMRGQPGQGGFPGGGGPPGGPGGFNPMQRQQQQQLFAGGNPAAQPMRMGSIGGMNMDDHGMGHPGMAAMGGMPMGGGMPGMAGGPQNMSRRMTRGMGEDGFAMHQ